MAGMRKDTDMSCHVMSEHHRSGYSVGIGGLQAIIRTQDLTDKTHKY